MLKIFTVKYSEKSENFPDSAMSDFLSDKEVRRCFPDAEILNRCLVGLNVKF